MQILRLPFAALWVAQDDRRDLGFAQDDKFGLDFKMTAARKEEAEDQ
jgi:hypothetical protein